MKFMTIGPLTALAATLLACWCAAGAPTPTASSKIVPSVQPVSRACYPTFQWRKADCESFDKRLAKGECPVDLQIWPYHAVWIGAGCPSPCVLRARAAGINPQLFCKRVGMYPRFQDGGARAGFGRRRDSEY